MRRLLRCLVVVVATLAAAAAHAQAQQPAGTATVRGTVTAEDTGEPIRGASVHVWVVPPGRSDSEGAVHLSTTSDANGAFAFSEVPAGSASLAAMKDGFYNLGLLDADDPKRRVTPRFRLARGETVEKVPLTLGRGGAVAGRVLDEHGEPATGVEILLLRKPPGGGRLTSISLTVRSDDTGAFRLSGLQPGDYVVRATPEFKIQSRPPGPAERDGFAPTYFPGTTSISAATIIHVRGGEETTGVTFSVVTARLTSIRGRVTEANGEPAATTPVVMVYPLGGAPAGGSGSRAAADGTFEISKLPPGRYRIVAREGRNPWRTVTRAGVIEVNIDGTDVDDVAISLRFGSGVTGHIEFDGSEPMRRPLLLHLVPDHDGGSDIWVAPVEVQVPGSFTIANVFGRRFVRLRTTGPSSIPLEVMHARASSPGAPPPPIAIAAVLVDGEDVTDRAIELDGRPVSLTVHLTSRLTEVSGTVQRSITVVGGATRTRVVLFPDDPTRWHEESVSIRVAPVADDGRFLVRGAPPGDDYLIVAVDGLRAAGYLPEPAVLKALKPLATSIRLDAGTTRAVSLTAVRMPDERR